MQQRNLPEALKLYARLVKEAPKGELYVEYGHAALLSGDIDLAERLWEKARSVESGNVQVIFQIAAEYQKIGLHAKARAFYAEAAKKEPDNLLAQFALASKLAEISSVKEARVPMKRCLELDSANEEVRALSAQLDRRENKLAEAEKQLRDMLTAGVEDPATRCNCHFELAQILDRTKRYDEAMAALTEAKNLARQSLNAESEMQALAKWRETITRTTKALPKNILDTWNKSFPERVRTTAQPVALLGGPARSGATLLEKVLGAHPSVAADDEARAFQDTLALTDVTAPIPVARLNILRERYLKMFGKALGSSLVGKIVLDKNPQPTIFLPAFLRVFPKLRTLIALRDPRDAILSLYFQSRSSSNFLPLEQLAQHYAFVVDIWLTIREWEGLAFTEVRYENLVADVKKEGERATKFLGLEWHKDQTKFYEKNLDQPIMSANYDDVTRPVYTRSVGRWKNYEKHLAPILPILEPCCKKLGYT